LHFFSLWSGLVCTPLPTTQKEEQEERDFGSTNHHQGEGFWHPSSINHQEELVFWHQNKPFSHSLESTVQLCCSDSTSAFLLPWILHESATIGHPMDLDFLDTAAKLFDNLSPSPCPG
jgi:hypothetical protein